MSIGDTCSPFYDIVGTDETQESVSRWMVQ